MEKNQYSWNQISLTPLEESDLDLLYGWQNSPNIRDLMMGFRFPIQKETVKEWIRNIRDQNSKSRIVFAIRVNSLLVGLVTLQNIDVYQRKSMFSIYIGKTIDQNSGIGFMATSLILDYAFNGLDFRKINLEVISFNSKAINLYEKLGFVKEGIKRQEYFIDGKYTDVHIYGILHKEFVNLIPHTANRLIYSFNTTS